MSYMGRKVFVSVLGVGFYGECIYKRGDFESEKTRFIQQATLEMLTNNDSWTAEDQGYILLTEGARVNNWVVDGNVRINKATNSEETYLGLKETIHEMNLPFAVEGINIPVGNNEDEIWQIFDMVFGKLQDGDELYFDITHGFRYLPMLVLVLGNYAKFLKRVTVRSITYGNFESADKALCPPVAPIIDITSFSALQDWTFSGASFVEQGHVRNFTESISLSLGNSSLVSKKLIEYVRKLNKDLNTFEEQIATCRGNELFSGNNVCEAKELIGKVIGQSYIPRPLLKILDVINDAIIPFDKDTIDNLRSSIIWCKRYKLIQQGYTLCQESIITYICMQLNELNPYKTEERGDRRYRDYWSAILGMSVGDAKNEGSWKGDVAKNMKLSRSLFNMEWVREARKGYDRIKQKRNQLNHAGFTGKVPSHDIIKSFDKNIDWCVSFFDEKLTAPVVESSTLHKLFINLSNHPSSQWKEEQLCAARDFGEIMDMPFPQVNPDAMAEDVNSIANDLVDKIKVLESDNDVVVHVMGEMGLTYCIVKKLSAIGIRCVCSTSYRIVKEEDEGKRLVEFHFNKFRDYE